MHYILDGSIVISTNFLLDSKDGHNSYIEIKTCVPILVTKRSTLDKKLLSCNILTIKELQQDRRYKNNLRDVCSFFCHIKDKHINHKNYHFLACDWFKNVLFSTNLLVKLLSDSLLLDSLLLDSLLSDSLLSDSLISQSHSKM